MSRYFGRNSHQPVDKYGLPGKGLSIKSRYNVIIIMDHAPDYCRKPGLIGRPQRYRRKVPEYEDAGDQSQQDNVYFFLKNKI